jgi:PIN domain nuclease of toxin-antitoxin system
LRTLLDTHVLFWWLTDDPKLSPEARRAVETDAEGVLVSIATAWDGCHLLVVSEMPKRCSQV